MLSDCPSQNPLPRRSRAEVDGRRVLALYKGSAAAPGSGHLTAGLTVVVRHGFESSSSNGSRTPVAFPGSNRADSGICAPTDSDADAPTALDYPQRRPVPPSGELHISI